MTKRSVAVLFLTLAILGKVSAFPRGPPTSVCTSMLPSHGVTARSDASPYGITANVDCFSPGSRVLLTLRDPLGTSYTGLFVQARAKSATSINSFGTFDINGNSDLQTISCFGSANNALGHSNAQNKVVKTFGWTSPSGLATDIVFTYVVAKDYSNFWANVQFDLPHCVVAPSVLPPVISSTRLSQSPDNFTQVPENPTSPARPAVSNPTLPSVDSPTELASNLTMPSVESTTTTSAGSCVDSSPITCRRFSPKKCKNFSVKSRCCSTCSRYRPYKNSQSKDGDYSDSRD